MSMIVKELTTSVYARRTPPRVFQAAPKKSEDWQLLTALCGFSLSLTRVRLFYVRLSFFFFLLFLSFFFFLSPSSSRLVSLSRFLHAGEHTTPANAWPARNACTYLHTPLSHPHSSSKLVDPGERGGRVRTVHIIGSSLRSQSPLYPAPKWHPRSDGFETRFGSISSLFRAECFFGCSHKYIIYIINI